MVSMIKESPQDRASTSSQEALANKKRAVRKEKKKKNLGKINFQTLFPRWRENIRLGSRSKDN